MPRMMSALDTPGKLETIYTINLSSVCFLELFVPIRIQARQQNPNPSRILHGRQSKARSLYHHKTYNLLSFKCFKGGMDNNLKKTNVSFFK